MNDASKKQLAMHITMAVKNMHANFWRGFLYYAIERFLLTLLKPYIHLSQTTLPASFTPLSHTHIFIININEHI